jgi:hypothetical protein
MHRAGKTKNQTIIAEEQQLPEEDRIVNLLMLAD